MLPKGSIRNTFSYSEIIKKISKQFLIPCAQILTIARTVSLESTQCEIAAKTSQNNRLSFSCFQFNQFTRYSIIKSYKQENRDYLSRMWLEIYLRIIRIWRICINDRPNRENFSNYLSWLQFRWIRSRFMFH
jgi:hypothetical protein